MKKRSLLIMLLVMLAMVTSGFTYAFWASSITGNNNTATGTITIGEGGTVATAVTVGNETATGLVPTGFEDDVNTFSSIDLTYTVAWTSLVDDADGAVGTVSAVASSILIGGSSTYAGLVTVDVATAATNVNVTLNGATVDLIVTVTLSEPLTQAAYEAVAGANITFTLTFTVTPPTIA